MLPSNFPVVLPDTRPVKILNAFGVRFARTKENPSQIFTDYNEDAILHFTMSPYLRLILESYQK